MKMKETVTIYLLNAVSTETLQQKLEKFMHHLREFDKTEESYPDIL